MLELDLFNPELEDSPILESSLGPSDAIDPEATLVSELLEQSLSSLYLRFLRREESLLSSFIFSVLMCPDMLL